MRRLLFSLMLILPAFLPCAALSHGSTDETTNGWHANSIIPASIEQTMVQITEENGKRVFRSNGIPNHRTGTFPNANNPNRISIQNHYYQMPINPQRRTIPQEKDGIIGIALNGIPFEPGTAECYGQRRGSRPNPDCKWREEAIIGNKRVLGLDSSNAHVQPNGTYHYHGIPNGLVSFLQQENRSTSGLIHVGYAADGYPLYVSNATRHKSSYRLKTGTRPDGPGGRYDGTYTQDYEFIAGLGSLDRCNGAVVNGEYAYFLTEDFPFAPRCLYGEADSSFERRGRGNSGGFQQRGHRPPPPHHRR